MTEIEMFLVQKCWFDGPKIQPPQDFLAIFPNRSHAEQVASASAYMHAAACQAVVRTILLPSGYAFSAGGDLFWIRSVYVNLDHDVLNPGSGAHYRGAHAIANRGVIGGTGNVNSRRGSEVQTGVVFVGSDSHSRALQVIMRDNIPAKSQVIYLPFGPLPNLLDGWTGTSFKNEAPALSLEDPDKKRSAMQATNVVLQCEALAECSDLRPMKRHCYRVDPHCTVSHYSA